MISQVEHTLLHFVETFNLEIVHKSLNIVPKQSFPYNRKQVFPYKRKVWKGKYNPWPKNGSKYKVSLFCLLELMKLSRTDIFKDRPGVFILNFPACIAH